MWVLLVILALIVASLLFGSFQKGTRSALPALPRAPASTSASLPNAPSAYPARARSASDRLR
jgi:hypothetical protein